MHISNRTIVITGGTRGIGYATARAFLHADARVAICGIDEKACMEAKSALSAIGDVYADVADVRDHVQMRAFLKAVYERYERIDVLINNAGVAWAGSFRDETPENITHLVDVNVTGVLNTTHAALPYLERLDEGMIVNIASGAGRTGIPYLATYSATKFAVCGFTEALAGEYRGSGIGVYAVCPGAVATDMQEAVSGERVGMPPEEVALQIYGLVAGDHDLAPGECLTVSG